MIYKTNVAIPSERSGTATIATLPLHGHRYPDDPLPKRHATTLLSPYRKDPPGGESSWVSRGLLGDVVKLFEGIGRGPLGVLSVSDRSGISC